MLHDGIPNCFSEQMRLKHKEKNTIYRSKTDNWNKICEWLKNCDLIDEFEQKVWHGKTKKQKYRKKIKH